jgi:universal stress protein E
MRMIQSILLPVDFHQASADVARIATQMAAVFDSHLTLLHVLEPTLISPSGMQYARERATERMRELIEQLALDRVVIDESAIAVGSPIHQIVRKAEEIDAGLVVMGTGERSRFGRPPGPTTQGVLQHARQPVLAVRSGEPEARFARILCPVDQSPVSLRGLRNAIQLARAFHGHLVVLSVAPGALPLSMADGTWPASVLGENEQSWREDFDRSLKEVDFGNVSRQSEVRVGLAHEQIVAAARDHRADVIVMGSTGRSGLARLLMGSVTRRVVEQLPCSLLTVKSEDLLEELAEGDIKVINLLLVEGQEMLEAGCNAEAAGKFRLVLLQNAFSIPALEGLAAAYMKLGRSDEAKRYRHRAELIQHG